MAQNLPQIKRTGHMGLEPMLTVLCSALRWKRPTSTCGHWELPGMEDYWLLLLTNGSWMQFISWSYMSIFHSKWFIPPWIYFFPHYITIYRKIITTFFHWVSVAMNLSFIVTIRHFQNHLQREFIGYFSLWLEVQNRKFITHINNLSHDQINIW